MIFDKQQHCLLYKYILKAYFIYHMKIIVVALTVSAPFKQFNLSLQPFYCNIKNYVSIWEKGLGAREQ